MEFLDDLQEQREAGKRDPKKVAPSQNRADQDQDPWEALLAGASFDAPQAEAPEGAPRRETEPAKSRRGKSRQEKQRVQKGPKPGRKAPARRGMSGGQKMLLGALALLVILLWAGIAGVLSGRLSLGTTFGALQPVMAPTSDVGLLPPVEPETPTATAPAPTPVVEQVQPTATREPTQTPVPVPMVPTVYDSQILKDPDNVDLYLSRGEVYLDLGVYDAAFADYEHAITLNPQRYEGYIGMGWSLYYVFDWDNARAAFEAAVQWNQDAEEAHFALGLLHYHQGAYTEAAREFDTAAEINPLHAEAEAWLALSAARIGDEQEAADAVARALNLTQNLPIVYIARSGVHMAQDPPNLEGAHGDLLYALNMEPNQFLTLNALASFYADHRPDRLSEAEVRAMYAGEWAKNQVEEALALQTLGRVYLALDRKADAARVLIEAQDLAMRDGKTYLAGLLDDLERTR